jgi:hypothetical protein
VRLRRRSTILAAVLGGTLSVTWPRRAALISSGIRSLSRRKPNPATARGIRVDLGRSRGLWSATSLAADLSPHLTKLLGERTEGAVYSRFGGFTRGRPYSAFLDPESPYYQTWLGAFILFDRPRRRPVVGKGEQPDLVELGHVLDAIQRLVYVPAGCDQHFEDGSAIRPLGQMTIQDLRQDDARFWRVTGQLESWSTYCHGGSPRAPRRGRFLFGKVPRKAPRLVDDFHPLTYSAEIWLNHDDSLGATCARFLFSPTFVDRGGQTRTPGQQLLSSAPSLFRQIRFLVDLP